jgi:hypothetical protein
MLDGPVELRLIDGDHRQACSAAHRGLDDEEVIPLASGLPFRMTTIALRPIGKVESRLTDLADAPRQADEGAPDACLVIDADFAVALEGLKVGDEVIVITWLDRAARHPAQSPARRSVTAPGRRVHDTVAAPPQSARAAPGHRRRHRRRARARPEPRSRGWYADPRHQGVVEPRHSTALRYVSASPSRPVMGCLYVRQSPGDRMPCE